MRRFIAAWEKVIQAHISSKEWSMYVNSERLSPEEQELFRGLLRALIKPQPSMPLEVIDALSGWALGEIDAVRKIGKHLDRIRFNELQAHANGLARVLAYQTDWASAIEELPETEPEKAESEERPTVVAPPPETRETVPVPKGLSEELLASCRPPKPAPLPVFTDHETPTARGMDVEKAIAQAVASADEAEISYGHEFVDLDLDDEPDG